MTLGALFVAGACACKDQAARGVSPEASPSNAPGSAAFLRDAPESAAPPAKVTVESSAMGTRLTFVTVTSDRVGETATRSAIDQAILEIRRLEGLMTTWRDDSEVSRVNQNAGKKPVLVGPETREVIDKSLWISKKSGGVFDVTFEVMRGVWRFDQDLDPRVPDASVVAERRKLIDYRHIVIDHQKSTVFLASAASRISLGGIAKGYAIDRAAEILLRAGVDNFLVQAGGDLYMHGRRADGSPWVAGIRDPRGPEESHFARMPVVDHAFSTAGDYERAFLSGGKRYHHIIDPRTGYPATASRSVTIWAKDALTADALDDAVFILGPIKGLELVESIEEAGAVIVDAENRVHVSKRLDGRVIMERPPTAGP